MRCYFMRNGHIATFQEFSDLSDEEATNRSYQLCYEMKDNFDGFELWDGARMIIKRTRPNDLEPKTG
jgi:hypothetical protein